MCVCEFGMTDETGILNTRSFSKSQGPETLIQW